METVDIVVGAIGLLIAIWALNLQRLEIRKNGKIIALIQASHMIQERIDYQSKIIDDLKQKGKKWDGHAARINNELRPLKTKIDLEFINLITAVRLRK